MSNLKLVFTSYISITLLFFTSLLFSVSLDAQIASQALELTGEASVVIIDDFNTGQSEFQYFLVDQKTGKEKQLFFKDKAPKDFVTGKKVKVRGKKNDRGVEVESVTALEEPSADPGSGDGTQTAVATPETRKILTLLVDFNDAVVAAPGGSYGTDVQAVKDRMYNETKSVAGQLFNSSLGTLTLVPDADNDQQQDVFLVSINDSYIGGDPSQCNSSTWVNLASSAWEAANPTKDIDIYRHRLLIVPNYWDYGNRHCTWGGVAQVGCGNWCWAIGADPDTIMHGVIIHELGHNLGFNHARTDENNNGYDPNETETDNGYGDKSDMMGSSRNWMKFNAPHAEDKGWIDPVNYEIRPVTASSSPQTFDLLAMDDEVWNWPGLRALKLERSANTDYYVSYRLSSGDYNNVTSTYRNKVNIHYGFDNSTYTYFVAALSPGQSFTDTAQDLVITATSEVAVSNEGLNTTAIGVEICQQTCSDLPAPSGLAAAAQSTDTIDLSWNDNSSTEDGFEIQRSLDDSTYSALATVAANDTGYTDLGLATATTYYYRVRATEAGNTSAWSNTASDTTLAIPPVADFTYLANFLDVDFTDASTDNDGIISGWSWDFGDGNGSSAQNPSYSYGAAGTFQVSLTVTDDDGASDNSSQSLTVFEAPNVPPTAGFSVSTNQLAANFTDTSIDSDGTIASWSWDFGDGGNSGSQNPSHVYATAGTYTVSLTVTDNDGDSHAVNKSVTVTAPPATQDYPADSDTPVAGSVSGSYLATAEDDGLYQSITERDSGGRKSSRYSYLEHRWTFNIPSGTSASVSVNAWQSPSSDGDSFDFAWSSDGNNWDDMFNVMATSDGTPLAFELPEGTSGTVYIRVRDGDRTPGNRSFDTVFVDGIWITVSSAAVELLIGDAPIDLAATATSHSTVELSWADRTSNEAGFVVERSTNGGSFALAGTTGPNGDSSATFIDAGVQGSKTYTYRVHAYKGSDRSAESNTDTVTTDAAPAMTIGTTGYKVKGRQKVDVTWTGATTDPVTIFRDSAEISTANDGAYTDNIDRKGGGTYVYQVCESGDSTVCSAESIVVF